MRLFPIPNAVTISEANIDSNAGYAPFYSWTGVIDFLSVRGGKNSTTGTINWSGKQVRSVEFGCAVAVIGLIGCGLNTCTFLSGTQIADLNLSGNNLTTLSAVYAAQSGLNLSGNKLQTLTTLDGSYLTGNMSDFLLDISDNGMTEAQSHAIIDAIITASTAHTATTGHKTIDMSGNAVAEVDTNAIEDFVGGAYYNFTWSY